MLNLLRVILGSGIVLTGDCNPHHSRWNPGCHPQWNAVFWQIIMDKDGLDIGNQGWLTQYWKREDHEGELIIE